MVTVRFFAGARAAAGVAEARVSATTVAELKAVLVKEYGAELARVLPACGLLVDGVSNHEDLSTLTDGATVDVLPPFAGG
ncbi:MoaD/ThiS family protein [Stackebrandtia nassauensis]|uniref:ThiamineS protein n=1 Tax=Stackebrandtia nassauensis (strain DSM 44728 / CIP 108903 / NRRL B-16338 / NBRC 102104 / LLR-40K-21) TaxID=446470 RepID=D3Q4B4_STANL|nr:MoaD/ThiS family protein [Stackebrandtia nassauensis]ADD40074.1 thiamineS protein [Stackebrandtia nassauensis DSM 44728]